MATPALTATLPLRVLSSRLVKFAVVGGLSTAVHLGLFSLLEARTGLGPQVSNLTALLIATVLNTGVNRAWTFGVSGSDQLVRQHMQSLIVFALTWAASAGALWALSVALPQAPHELSVAVVGAAMALTTVARFVAMNRWIFRTA